MKEGVKGDMEAWQHSRLSAIQIKAPECKSWQKKESQQQTNKQTNKQTNRQTPRNLYTDTQKREKKKKKKKKPEPEYKRKTGKNNAMQLLPPIYNLSLKRRFIKEILDKSEGIR